MQQTQNTFTFVQSVLQRLTHVQINVWLAGGWAEELRNLRAPGPHHDIDLLYPAVNFDHLDHWVTSANDLEVIVAKRFSHKRALLWKQVMVEFVLLEPGPGGYVTNFFDGRYQLIWPLESLSFLHVENQSLPVASCQSLQLYRQHHQYIAQAFQTGTG